jgi:Icc-related predicted phosphoesterase
MAKTKILFCTDVHGSDTVFRKFLNASKMYKVNAAIIGGDITGKALVLISEKSGTYEADLLGRRWVARNEEELGSVIKEFRKRGYYTHIADFDSVEEIKANPAKAEEILKQRILESVKGWIQLAQERLENTGIRCYISPGNDDMYEIDPILDSSDFVINPEGKVVMLDGQHEMITLGNVNITPWNCPRDVPEEELSKIVQNLASEVKNPSQAVFNLHAPPHGTFLDLAPELDANLSPVIKAGQPSMIHVGSVSVSQAIEKHQPLLGLHGHIHESKAVEKIGRTVCINPGSTYWDGTLNGVIAALEKDAEDHMFISG